MKTPRDLYEGPGSHGALRAISGMRGVRAVLRALPSETYFQAFFTSRERSGQTPPVVLSPMLNDREGSFSPGDLGRDLARTAARHPDTETLFLVRSDASLLSGEELPTPDLPENPRTGEAVKLVTCEELSYDTKELAAADLVSGELVRAHTRPLEKSPRPTVNLFGPPVLNPGAAAEYEEAGRLLGLIGVDVNARLPLGADVEDLSHLSRAWANILLYRETGDSATLYLQDEFGMPRITTPMIGAAGTGAVLRSIGDLCKLDPKQVQRAIFGELGQTSKLPWFARLIPPEMLRRRRAAIFGDLTYTLGLGYALAREVGLEVAWAGTYLEHLERDFRFNANSFTDDAFFADDPAVVATRVEETQPDLLIGTHLEAAAAEAFDIPFLPLCPPTATQPFVETPLMGYTGSSHLADTLEEALRRPRAKAKVTPRNLPWTEDALEELEEVPAFLRGRARRLAEEHAEETGEQEISREIFERSRF